MIPRSPRGPLPLVGALALTLGSFAACDRFRRDTLQPWEQPGISMVERLASIERAQPRVWGPTPQDFLKRPSMLNGHDQASLEFQHNLALALMKRGDFKQAAERLESLIAYLKAEGRIGSELGEKARYSLAATYLRSGEVENCLGNHNYDSCLLPIQGGGVHRFRRGSEAARGVVLDILQDRPDDVLAKWLLNLIAMTLGEYPEAVPLRWRIDPQVFRSDADFPRFFDVAHELGLAVDDISGSSCLEDFDGDGDLDLIASSMRLTGQLRYFENRGDGSFTERTREAGLTGLTGGLNVIHADYDNDGLADVLVLRGAWMGPMGRMPNSLLHNEGEGRFRDVTEEAGLLAFFPTQTAAWADYDNDGNLDLYVGSESRERGARLYHNRGDGTFEDVIEESGIQPIGFVKGACWGDYDNDGLEDLYVSCNGMPNALYRNLGKGHFEDATAEAKLGRDPGTFACWFFDYDNDGNLDLFVAGYSARFASSNGAVLTDIPAARLGLPIKRDVYPRLYHNRGNGTFENVAREAGLERVVLTMGANFGDVNNDGWQDVYCGTGHTNFLALMANRMFINDRGSRFLDVTTAGGFGHLQKGHGISFGDVDNDGDQDVYAVMGGWFPADNFPNALYANPGTPNHWVTLRFRGEETNRLGLGVRVRLRLATPQGPRSVHRRVDTGGSFGANSLQLEVGLGDATGIEVVEVFWPVSRRRQRFENVKMDRVWLVREGQERLLEVPSKPFSIEPSGSAHAHHALHEG